MSTHTEDGDVPRTRSSDSAARNADGGHGESSPLTGMTRRQALLTGGAALAGGALALGSHGTAMAADVPGATRPRAGSSRCSRWRVSVCW